MNHGLMTLAWSALSRDFDPRHDEEEVVHVPKVMQQERQHHFHVEDGHGDFG